MPEIAPKPDYLLIKLSPYEETSKERFGDLLAKYSLIPSKERSSSDFLFDYVDLVSCSLAERIGSYLPKQVSPFSESEPKKSIKDLFDLIWNELLKIKTEITTLRSEMIKQSQVDTNFKPVILFFKNRDEFNNRFLVYLDEHNLYSEVRQGGVVIVNESLIQDFKQTGFNFVVVPSMRELNLKYKQELDDYANQVRKHYGLAGKQR